MWVEQSIIHNTVTPETNSLISYQRNILIDNMADPVIIHFLMRGSALCPAAGWALLSRCLGTVSVIYHANSQQFARIILDLIALLSFSSGWNGVISLWSLSERGLFLILHIEGETLLLIRTVWPHAVQFILDTKSCQHNMSVCALISKHDVWRHWRLNDVNYYRTNHLCSFLSSCPHCRLYHPDTTSFRLMVKLDATVR